MTNDNIFYGDKISIIPPNEKQIKTYPIPFQVRHIEIYQEIAKQHNISLKNPNSDTECPKDLADHGLIVINSLLLENEPNLIIYLPENPDPYQQNVIQNYQKDLKETQILTISFKENNRRYDLSDKRIIKEIIKLKLGINPEETRSPKR